MWYGIIMYNIVQLYVSVVWYNYVQHCTTICLYMWYGIIMYNIVQLYVSICGMV